MQTQLKYFRQLLILLLLFLAACRPDEPIDPAKPDQPKDSVSVDTPDRPGDTLVVDDRTPDQKRDLPYLFDMESLPTVVVKITVADWNTLLRNYDAHPSNSFYVPARWEFSKKGAVYRRDSVGLRLRGNTSRTRPESWNGQMHRDGGPWHHAHFGICFTEYESGERFFGCDRLQLKWCHEDPTYVREVFSYDLMRRFGVWSAPYASYCRLYISVDGDASPAYYGVYAMVENPRKGWLHDREKEGYIPDADGNIWKCKWPATLYQPQDNQMGISDDYGENKPTYDLKTNKKHLDEAKAELRSFCNDLLPCPSGSETLRTYLRDHVDVDLFLRAMAADVALGQWDGYWGNTNNYYIYFDSNHRLYYIPYDYDNVLGTGQEVFHNPGTQEPLQWNSRESDRLLVRKVLSLPENQVLFKQYLHQLLTDSELMEPAAAKQRVRAMQSLIRPYISNDTGEDCELKDRPASWSHYPQYRLLSGSVGDGKSRETNFFDTKYNCVINTYKY